MKSLLNASETSTNVKIEMVQTGKEFKDLGIRILDCIEDGTKDPPPPLWGRIKVGGNESCPPPPLPPSPIEGGGD
jgi:hypothetical protein